MEFNFNSKNKDAEILNAKLETLRDLGIPLIFEINSFEYGEYPDDRNLGTYKSLTINFKLKEKDERNNQ